MPVCACVCVCSATWLNDSANVQCGLKGQGDVYDHAKLLCAAIRVHVHASNRECLEQTLHVWDLSGELRVP